MLSANLSGVLRAHSLTRLSGQVMHILFFVCPPPIFANILDTAHHVSSASWKGKSGVKASSHSESSSVVEDGSGVEVRTLADVKKVVPKCSKSGSTDMLSASVPSSKGQESQEG